MVIPRRSLRRGSERGVSEEMRQVCVCVSEYEYVFEVRN